MPLPPRPTLRPLPRGSFSSRLKTLALLIGLAASAGFVSYTFFTAGTGGAAVEPLATPALAPGESPWARLGETLAMTTYWDRSTAQREGYTLRVWEIQDMKAADPEGVMSRQYRAEYDCKHAMHRIGNMESYAGPMLTGKKLFDVNEMGYWRTPPPDSVFAKGLQMHCGNLLQQPARSETEKAPWWAPFWPFK